jgi:hypothetical protein
VVSDSQSPSYGEINDDTMLSDREDGNVLVPFVGGKIRMCRMVARTCRMRFFLITS